MGHSRSRGRLWGAISSVAISCVLLGGLVQTASAASKTHVSSHKTKTKKKKKVNPDSIHGTITVYAALTTQGGEGFVQAFEHVYPNVTVNMVTGGTGSLETELLTQAKSNDIQPDIVLFADPSSMGVLNQEHLLSPWTPSLAGRKVPAGYKGSGWVGAFSFENVIVYKTGMSNPPTTWTSLESPSLKGEVAIGSASYSGTTFGWAAELQSKLGWSYFQNLKSNDVRVENSTTTTGTDVASGRDEAAVTLDSVARSLIESGANISVDWPSDGSVICPAPVGLTWVGYRNKKKASEAFVTWLLSRDGQVAAARLGYDAAYFGAKPTDPVPKSAKILYPNWNKFGKDKNSILNEYSSIFG